MTGPEHYQRAEYLIRYAKSTETDSRAAQAIQMAQVHATLAHAAATAMGSSRTGAMPGLEYEAWRAATAPKETAS